MPEWILCKDKLPKKGQIVLITDGKQVGFGFMGLHGDKRSKSKPVFYQPILLQRFEGMIAWQPLPKPYKGK